MLCTSPRAWAGFAAASALLQPALLHAAESDSEMWVELSALHQIAPDTNLRLEVEQRRREGADDRIAGAQVEVASGPVALGAGLELHDAAGFTEVRPFQQVSWRLAGLTWRTRMEERVPDGADRPGLRLRQRAQFSAPLGPASVARLSAELLYQLRASEEGGPRRIDQWMFVGAVQHRIAPKLFLTAAYLLQVRPRPAGQTRHTHVPQLALAYTF